MPEIISNRLIIDEDQTQPITLNQLNAEDTVDSFDVLEFSIANLQGGRFELVETVNGVETVTVLADGTISSVPFTGANILDNQIRFVQDGTETAPSYTVTVTNSLDESDSSAADVTFTPVNDFPLFEVNQITVPPDGSVILNNTEVNGSIEINLQSTDEETADENLTYSVVEIAQGQFEAVTNPGTPITEFTQAQVDAGQVAFVDDPTSVLPPSYTLEVSDNTGGTVTREVNLLNANDFSTNLPPTLTANSLTLKENQTVSVTSQFLNATDPDGPDDSLVFTINPVVDPETGNSLLAGSFLVTNSLGEVQTLNTFTRADVISGRVRFRHNGSNVAPQYTVQVSDGTTTSAAEAASVSFQSTNDQPLFTTNTLSITEGESVILDQTNLLTTDEESGPTELTYTLESVSNGSFALVNPTTGELVQALSVGSSFTQADVAAGTVQFTHDGSELAPAYTLEVTDTGINGDPSTVLSVSRQVTIPAGGFVQVNDAPVLEVNQLTLSEGDTVTLNNSQNLRATDIEDNNANLLFTITEVTNGRFERVTNGTVEILADGTQEPVPFSQEDILQSRIRFVHDPATDAAPTYTVAVSDLGDPAQVTAESATINFTAENDSPVLQTFELTIPEGETVPLTQANLEVIDEETGAEGIVYTVDAASLAGGSFVLLADSQPVTTFTQADINQGDVIGFAQDGSNVEPSFALSVSDSTGQVITIESSNVVFDASNDAPEVQTAQLNITESGTLTLTRLDNLETTDEESGPAELTYTVTLTNPVPEKPDRFIVAGQEQLGPEITFTQAQVNAGQVQFIHGGSNQAPQLSLTVSDSFDPAAEAISVPVDLQIGFTAINDEPIFATNTLSIEEGQSIILDETNLFSSDEESGPAALTYTLLTVANGSFALVDATSGETVQALVVGDSFTQADVAAGTVQFTHDGSEVAPSYTLEVADDGINGDPTTVLSVPREVIIPDGGFIQVNDPPLFTANQLSLEEGDTVILSSQNLSATDIETNNDELLFTITEVSNGRFERVTGDTVEVLADGIQTPVAFSQSEILQSRIRFVHDPATDIPPAYTVAVSDLGDPTQSTTEPATIDFTAENDLPVLQTLDLSIGEDATVPLTQANLEVTDEETGPEGIVYTVDEASLVGGQFVLLADGTAVTSFTQADINLGSVIGFAQDGSNTAPQFSLTVADNPPEAGGQSILIESGEIVFIPTNDAPEVQTAQLVISEDETVTLSGELNLSTIDEESGPEALTYTVTLTNPVPEQPARFIVAGEEQLGPEITFTQAQVDAGAVQFVQGGANQAPELTVTVSDTFDPAAEAITLPVDFQLDFTPINDAPVFVSNTLSIEEGQSVVLGPTQLLTTDEESGPEDLTYTIDSVSGGVFQVIDPASQTVLETLEAGGSFTQASVNSGAIQFTQDGNEDAPAYTLTVTDSGTVGDETPKSETLPLTIPEGGFVNINDAPEFTANTLTIAEGETVTLGLENIAATDIDSVDSRLKFFFSQVAGGQFLLNGQAVDETTAVSPSAIAFGELTFVDDGLEGPPSYVVTVTDPQGGSTEAAADIVYTPVNDAPEVIQNSFTIAEGERITLNDPDTGTVNLLAEDAETLSPANLIYTVDEVTGGRFANFLNQPVTSFSQQELNDGDILFEHNGEETAPSFSFTLSDPDGGDTTFAGDIEFVPVNDPPVLTASSLAVEEGQAVVLTTANFNATDPDTPDEAIIFTVESIEGGQFNLDSNGDGSFDQTAITSFTLAQIAGAQVEFVDDGDEFGPSFSISVTDGELASDVVPVVPDYTPVNDPPIAVDDSGDGFTTTADVPLTTASVLANDSDADLEDFLTVTAVNGAPIEGTVVLPSGAELSLEGDGRFLYTPSGVFDALGAGESATDSFEYTVTDLSGATDQATVEILINGVNDLPVAVNDSGEGFATDEDSALQTPSLLANDSDADENDVLSIIEINGAAVTAGTPITLASGALLTLNGDGTVFYDPADAFDPLDAGDSAVDSFEYTLSDGSGTAQATAEIAIAGVNDVPVAANDGGEGFTTTEGLALTTGILTANDIDIDADDVLTVTQINGTAIAADGPPLTLESGALVSLNADGSLNYNPNGVYGALVDGETATEVLSYTVTDTSGAASTAVVELLINGANSTPILESDLGTTSAREAIVLDVLANDLEPDAGDSITVAQIDGTAVTVGESVTLASGATVALNEDGTLTYQPAGFEALGPLESGLETFEYTVTDTQGNLATSTVELTITGLAEPEEGIFTLPQLDRFVELDRGGNIPFNNTIVAGLELPLLFDETYYLANNPDVATAVANGLFGTGYEHFVVSGQFEGRNPSTVFDEAFYLEQNPDVAAAIGNGFSSGFRHFATAGHLEGRDPSSLFDQSAYLDTNPDVAAAVGGGAFGSGFEHYLEAGAGEGRVPNLLLFDEAFYLRNNPDVADSVVAGSFDSGFQHYVLIGQSEGRDPSLLFDESSYLTLNPDVLDAKRQGAISSGFEHYIFSGRAEGREVFA